MANIEEIKQLRVYTADCDQETFNILSEKNILPIILLTIPESSYLVPWKNTMINIHGFSPDYGTWKEFSSGNISMFKELYLGKLYSRSISTFLKNLWILMKVSNADGVAILGKLQGENDPIKEVISEWINSSCILSNEVTYYGCH